MSKPRYQTPMFSSSHVINPTNSNTNSNSKNAHLKLWRTARMKRTTILKSKRTANTKGTDIMPFLIIYNKNTHLSIREKKKH